MAEAPVHERDRDAEAAPTGAGAVRPGLREALIVGVAVVVTVLAAAGVTALLPADLRDVVFRTPLLILVLIVGTGGVLWWITRPGRAGSAEAGPRSAAAAPRSVEAATRSAEAATRSADRPER